MTACVDFLYSYCQGNRPVKRALGRVKGKLTSEMASHLVCISSADEEPAAEEGRLHVQRVPETTKIISEAPSLVMEAPPITYTRHRFQHAPRGPKARTI